MSEILAYSSCDRVHARPGARESRIPRGAGAARTILGSMRRAKAQQAFARRLEFRKAAAFLLDQVILNPAAIFRGVKQALPVRHAFTKQNGISLRRIGRPILAMHGADAARIRLNPCQRITSRLDACAD